MTVIHPNSISGITSVTSHSNSLYFYESDHSTKLTINAHVNGNVTSVNGDFSGNLNVGGTLTYEDVTNIDSVGIITARAGVNVTGGSVGIGTDNPGTKLDVRGGNWANGDIVVGQSGNAGRIKFRRGADGSDTGSIGFSAADNNSVLSMNVASGDGTLTFQTNSVERLRITSAGNLGIGIDPNFPIYTGTNARTLILGTGSEHSAIQIYSGGSSYGGLYFGDSTSGNARYMGYVEFKHGTNDDFLRFGTAAQERLRITSDGDVGIGDNAPNNNYGTNLSVHSTATDGARLKLSDGTTGKGNLDGLDIISTGGVAYFINRENADMSFSTGSSGSLRINSSGNIGINQVPTRELSLHSPNNNNALIHFTNDDTGETSGDGILVGLDGNENMVINNQETGKTINFYMGGSERLRIASDGKIAIGGNYGDTATFGRKVLISGTVGLNNDSGNIGMGFNRGSSNTYGYIGTGDWAVNGLSNDDFGISSGATGDLVFGTAAGTEKVRITSAGYVTKPETPFVMVHIATTSNRSTTGSQLQIPWDTIHANSTNSNNGSHFNTTNHRFTAPVAGRYMFVCSLNIRGDNIVYHRINGSNVHGAEYRVTQLVWDHVDSSLIYDMNANDYYEMYSQLYDSSGHRFNGGGNTGFGWDCLSIYLLG